MAALAACEIKFLQMLLEEIFYVKKPGILLEDNTGWMYIVLHTKPVCEWKNKSHKSQMALSLATISRKERACSNICTVGQEKK